MTNKEFLTLAFLMHGRTVPYNPSYRVLDAYNDAGVSSIGSLEKEGLVDWAHHKEGSFHITDKGMALIGEDDA